MMAPSEGAMALRGAPSRVPSPRHCASRPPLPPPPRPSHPGAMAGGEYAKQHAGVNNPAYDARWHDIWDAGLEPGQARPASPLRPGCLVAISRAADGPACGRAGLRRQPSVARAVQLPRWRSGREGQARSGARLRVGSLVAHAAACRATCASGDGLPTIKPWGQQAGL